MQLGDITYDLVALGPVGNPRRVTSMALGEDGDTGMVTFRLTQANGVFLRIDSTSGASVAITGPDGQTRLAEVPRGIDSYRFFSLPAGSYSMAVTPETEEASFIVDILTGPPDREAPGYLRWGVWYDSTTDADAGVFVPGTVFDGSGYLLWGQYHPYHQWLADGFRIDLQAPGFLVFDVSVERNFGWINLVLDSPDNPNTYRIIETSDFSGTHGDVAYVERIVSDLLLPGQYTLWLSGDGTRDGAPTPYGISARLLQAPPIVGTSGDETLAGTPEHDLISGLSGEDILLGDNGNDTLEGGDGADTLNGGDGDDVITGGATAADLRDVIYGGAGNDRIDAGHGNDLVYGSDGDDTVEGGFGVDEIIGQGGNDVLTGSAFSDLIFGGDGSDFINGGFGSDRVNGGAGADRFYHLGIADHGSDWIQDYSAADGDVLVWGGGAATRAQFQVNTTETPNAGAAGVEEAFVIYRPTGQILWALVDGWAQGAITLQIGGQVVDLLA
jgi:Ca2+-binding RTX toxin-like protein